MTPISRPAFDPALYLVTHRGLCRGRELTRVVAEAVAGGATLVQLREKETEAGEFLRLALELKKLLDGLGVPLIINDRADVALAAGASGVHIGQKDMPPEHVRRIIGPEMLLGLTIDSPDQLKAANAADIDYVSLGPAFPTSTKVKPVPPWGAAGVARARSETEKPLVTIGGITAQNAVELARAGADGVAVVSAVCQAESPRLAAADLARAVNLGKKKREGTK